MDHPEAARLMAAEKYLLNELSPELRKSFEEHLFECPECEFDVQAGYALIDGSKEVLSSKTVEVTQARVPGKPNQRLAWLRPAIAVPVMAVLVVVVSYQNLVTVPALKSAVASARAPQILNSIYLTAGTSRGAEQATSVKRNQPIALSVDIPTESRFTSYECAIQSPSGELEGSLQVSAMAARNSVSLSVYPRHGSGAYQLVVFGIPQDASAKVEIERQSFELQVQE